MSALPAQLTSLAAAALLSLAATRILARLAPRLRLIDPQQGAAPSPRKLQERPVAVVGGAAVLLATVALGAPVGAGWGLFGLAAPAAPAVVLALLLAFAAGLADDLRPAGLSASAKLLLQALAGAPLGVGVALANGLDPAAAALCGALGAAVALNALNTFDNADGAASALAACALAVPLPAAAGALLGFLPLNLDGGRRGRAAAPTAYLGDSGSHLVGMLVLAAPLAWPALVLPALDLARVALARSARGAAPWRGDRSHLAHRLAARGLGRGATVCVLVAVAAPALALGLAAAASGRAPLAAAGALGTCALYGLALLASRGRGGPEVAARILPPPETSR